MAPEVQAPIHINFHLLAVGYMVPIAIKLHLEKLLLHTAGTSSENTSSKGIVRICQAVTSNRELFLIFLRAFRRLGDRGQETRYSGQTDALKEASVSQS